LSPIFRLSQLQEFLEKTWKEFRQENSSISSKKEKSNHSGHKNSNVDEVVDEESPFCEDLEEEEKEDSYSLVVLHLIKVSNWTSYNEIIRFKKGKLKYSFAFKSYF